MLLNVPREEPLPPATLTKIMGPTGVRIGAVLSVVFMAEIVWALSRIGVESFGPDQAESVSSVRNIGRALFTDHAFAFEATSVLILVAMVGAVVLARKEH
jgi:NADH-quinone oxidoreductase subunit J